MRVSWVVLAAICVTARAGVPSLRTARGRTVLLGGRASVRLAEGMTLTRDAVAPTAMLDWGGVRFSFVVTSGGVLRGADLRARLAADSELGCARVERLDRGRGALVYGASPLLPRLANDRVLVYVAYGASPGGAIAVVHFYVSGDLETPDPWTAIARSIASTLDLRDAPEQSAPERGSAPEGGSAPERRSAPLPSGWALSGAGNRETLVSPHGACVVVDGELDPRYLAPDTAEHVPGRLRGQDMYWTVWRDHAGRHAETVVGAQHLGFVHVLCASSTSAELATQRALVERLWR